VKRVLVATTLVVLSAFALTLLVGRLGPLLRGSGQLATRTEPSRRTSRSPIHATAATSAATRFRFAVYFLPSPTSDPTEVVRRLLAEGRGALHLVSKKDDGHGSVSVADVDIQSFAPPSRSLPALAARFRKGLKPGERLLLKVPFRTDTGGREWMWVEVVSWEGPLFEGILENEPFEIADLKSGARVKSDESLVFDYVLYLADGRSEGNETGKIIEQREKAK
jgi:hypothetical protein